MDIKKRLLCLCTGVLALTIIVLQTVYFMSLPVCNIGLDLMLTKDGFQVVGAVADSPAGKAGIKKDMVFSSINEIDAHSWYEYRKTVPVSTFLAISSKTYQFGHSYLFCERNGTRHCFVLEKQPFLTEICFLPHYVMCKFLVALLFIACGLFCTFYYGKQVNPINDVHQFIMFLFCAGVAIYNAYTTIFEPVLSNVHALLFFDVGGVGSGYCLLSYFVDSFKKADVFPKSVGFITWSQVVFVCAMVAKYILVLLGVGNLLDAPWLFFAQFEMGLDCCLVVGYTIMMIIKLPKRMTVVFRIIIAGFLYAIFPTCFYLLRSALSMNFYVTAADKVVTLLPLTILPLSITLAVIQSKHMEAEKACSICMTFLGYLTAIGSILICYSAITGITLDSLFEYKFWLILLAISPGLFIIFETPVRRFLSLGSDEVERRRTSFEMSLGNLESENAILEQTAAVLKRETECSYVFIQLEHAVADNHVAYVSNKDVSIARINAMISESNKKKGGTVQSLSGGSCVVPLYHGPDLYGKIYIGPKKNNDEYLLSDFYMMSQYADVFMQTLLYRESVALRREKLKLHDVFSQYLSPALVDELTKNPDMVVPSGEKKKLTVLFTDIEGFTTLSESKTPDVIFRILNSYLNEMSAVVLAQGGTIDKFEGDAIMAFFGAPSPFPDHAERCCHAVLQMQKMQRVLNDQLIQCGLIDKPIKTRFGINTGEMIVGNVGSQQRLDYTVIGSEVNMASRIEEANKTYGTEILVSKNTWNIVKNSFEGKLVDTVQLRGTSTKVELYELLGEKNDNSIEEL